jgi:outer membrane receptor for ferrienterochelin and colicins
MFQLGKYLLTGLAILTSSIAFAQYDDTTEMGNTVVRTGNIKPTSSSQSVHNVKIINAATIERQGAVNLKDILTKELNVRIGNDNVLGTSLSLQGISGQNVKILLDGIPLTGRENGNIDLSQINLNNIDRIEIIEGPLSVIYGTDALGGVINLVSKNIMLSNDKPVMAFAKGYFESIKQYNFGAGATFKLNDVDFSASLNRNFFGGFNTDPSSRVMVWKPKQQVFGNFGIVNQTGKLKVRFTTDIFSEKLENRGVPVINHKEAYAYDEYYLTNRFITSLNLEYKINKTSYWNVLSSFSFYQRDKVTYRKDLTQTYNNMELVPSPDANSTNSFLNVMSRGTYNNSKQDKFNYQIGYDVNINSAFGTKIEADKGHMNDYALFACAEYKPVKQLSIKPGFRATYNTRYSAPFIPSIQGMYSLKNVTFRYAYGRGFRAPGLKELYLYFVDYNHNIVGNANLKSEMSDNHNAAIKFKIKLRKKYNLVVDNSYFFNTIYNQIALVSTNPIALEYTYANIDNFKSLGTNLNFAVQVNQWRINLGGSYTGIYNNAFELVGSQKYMYTPELRTQLSYAIKHKKQMPTVISLFHKYNGETFGYALDNTRNIVTTYTQDYHILDVSVNQTLMQKKINITFGLKNLLNVQDIRTTGNSASFHSSGSNSMPVSVGRSIFTQLNINL